MTWRRIPDKEIVEVVADRRLNFLKLRFKNVRFELEEPEAMHTTCATLRYFIKTGQYTRIVFKNRGPVFEEFEVEFDPYCTWMLWKALEEDDLYINCIEEPEVYMSAIY